MKKLYLDSNVLIYLAQPGSGFHGMAWDVLDIAERRGLSLLTSSLGYAEYGALGQKDGLRIAVEKLFANGDVTELPFGHEEAVVYAGLRTKPGKKIGAVDAMHVATALTNRADYLITNDLSLSTLKLPGLQLVYLPKAARVLSNLEPESR